MEFTVEQGKLWMLQTRGGKRTAKAALRIAVELANEGLISKKEAVTRIDPASLDQLLHPTIDPNAKRDVIATGLPASPGAASGEIVFSSDEAAKLQGDGRKVILVRVETSPEDIHGMDGLDGGRHQRPLDRRDHVLHALIERSRGALDLIGPFQRGHRQRSFRARRRSARSDGGAALRRACKIVGAVNSSDRHQSLPSMPIMLYMSIYGA